MDHIELTPELILQAYANGVFPMGEGRDDDRIYWVAPDMRGILPLDGFHISRSLARVIRKETYHVTFDRAFDAVMMGCADREETWINDTIVELYSALFDLGFAHSVEVWEGQKLVGGSYGIALGTAYFGESMFSRASNASKVALAFQTTALRRSGFTLFDTQFLTPHLQSLGGIEIPQRKYRDLLNAALEKQPTQEISETSVTAQDVLQTIGQRS